MADALKLAFVLSATDKMSRVINDAVNRSSGKLTAFERTASQVGRSMMKTGGLMAGAGVAIGAAALGAAKTTAEYGDSVWKSSQKTGMAVDEYQKLAYAAGYADVAQTEFDSSMVKLNKRLSEAANGSKTAGQVFNDLGISIRDAGGKVRAPNEIFVELSDRFSSMEDGAAKTARATDIFGKSGANLLPLLNGGSKSLKDMGDEAERLGFVMSAETAKACEQFNDNLKKVTDSSKGAMFQLGIALIPILDSLAQKITAVIAKVTQWVKENQDLVKTIASVLIKVSAFLVVVGTASVVIGAVTFAFGKFAAVWRGVKIAIAAGKALFAATSKSMLLFRRQHAALVVWQKLAAAAQWLFNSALFACPVVWIVAAVAAIGAAVYLLIKHWDKVSAFFAKLWEGVKSVFSATWEWIKTMFLNYTPHGLIIKHWDSISAWFSRLWDGVKTAFSAAWEWIKNMFLNYTPHGLIIKHWDSITAWFSRLWDGVKTIFTAAWDGIKNLFSSLNPLSWMSGIWENVTAFFTGLPTRFFDFGRNILTGLIDGIKSMASSAWDSITGVGEGIKDKFKSFFGINSPSTLFAEYGVNITQGLTGGIQKGETAVTAATEGLALNSTRTIGNDIAAAGNAAGNTAAAPGGGGVSLTYSPTINIQGTATPEAKDEFSKMLRAHRDEIIKILRQETENKTRLSFS